MSINTPINEREKENRRKEVIALLLKIKKGNLAGNSYSSDKQAISELFEKTNEDTEENILLCLTVIDSMYSTQMNRRYYGLEDLAKAMYTLKEEKKRSLKDMFVELANSSDTSMFDYSGGNLWADSYGIGKDGQDKGAAISLISKYAYFTTKYQFPIFDSIVCETLPSLSTYLGMKKPKMKCMDKKQNIIGDDTMKIFIKVINSFVHELSDAISYDSLDRLLWFVGKIRRGNLSLILSKDEYKECVAYCQKKLNTNQFDIKYIKGTDIPKLPFVKEELIPFFKLAKELGSLVKYPKKRKKNPQQVNNHK